MMEWITITAIFIGPLFAVLVTIYINNRKLKLDRKEDIFKTLMRTRRTPMNQDHIGALNLIELEYADQPKVIDEWEKLLEHFAKEHPRISTEKETASDTDETVRNKLGKFYLRLQGERQILLAKLLHKMAKSLKFKTEQLEIFEGGYTPQGWVNAENDLLIARQFIVDLANGKRLLPVGVIDYSLVNKENIENKTTKS